MKLSVIRSVSIGAAVLGAVAIVAAVAAAPFSPWSHSATTSSTSILTPPGAGQTRTPALDAPPGPTANYLAGILGLESNTAWDLTEAGLSVSEDGGRTWSGVALPAGVSASALSTTTSGTAVMAVANRAVWLAAREGDGYRVYCRLDSASSWTSALLVPTWPTQSGVSGAPESILITPGQGSLLTVAEYSGTGTAGAVTDLFVSTDNGLTFTQHPPVAGSGAWEYWRSVRFVNARSGVVVMGAATSDVSTVVYTSDGGSTWRDSSIAGLPSAGYRGFGTPTIEGSDIVVPASTWVDGANGPENAELRLLVSHDAGASFTAVGIALPLGSGFNPTTATIGSTTWVLSGSGGAISILETQDLGGAWSAIQPVGLPVGFLEIGLVSPTEATLLATGSGCPGKTICWTHAQLLATTDGGRTWSAVSPSPSATPSAAASR